MRSTSNENKLEAFTLLCRDDPRRRAPLSKERERGVQDSDQSQSRAWTGETLTGNRYVRRVARMHRLYRVLRKIGLCRKTAEDKELETLRIALGLPALVSRPPEFEPLLESVHIKLKPPTNLISKLVAT